MEMDKKRTDVGAPAQMEKGYSMHNKQFNSSKLNKLCLGIQIIAIIAFLWAYHKQAENALYLWGGVLITSMIIQAAINPMKEDE